MKTGRQREQRGSKELSEYKNNRVQKESREQKEPREQKDRENRQGGPKLKIIPLGGLEQIGMNITAFEYEDSIVVVDCGLAPV